MNQKQQNKKKKQREETAKKRVLARRNQLRADAKKTKEEQRAEKKYNKRAPFRKSLAQDVIDLNKNTNIEVMHNAKSFHEIKDEMIMERLRHNLEILKALEEEYQQEKANREQLNASLEGETLKEKMDNLAANAKKEIEKNTT